MVAGVAWRFGVARDDVEDAVSEVFIKVYRNLHRYRPDYPFATWLYRLAVNHVVDRGRRRRKERGRTEMPEQIADDAPLASDAVEAGERAALVREALSRLDDRYREPMILVYVEGMRVEETARILGIPEGTVKTRLMRGRAALRKILTDLQPGRFGD